MQGLMVMIRRRAGGSGHRWPALVAMTLLVGACAGSTTMGRSDTASSPAGSSAVQASSTQPASAEVEPTGAELSSDGLWVLQAGTVDGEPLAVEADAAVTMDVGDRQVGGQSACNDYGAEFDVDGDRLSITVTGGTDMGCGEAVEALEDAYLEALPRVTSFDRQADDRLVLTGDGVELVFVTEPPVDGDALVGRTWELLGLRNGESTQEAEGGGFIMFEEDGTVTGSTGCQEYEGTWTQDGSDVVFDNLSLDGQCDEQGLLQQHAAVAEPMFDPLTVTVSSHELVLATRYGLAMVYGSESDDPGSPSETAAPRTSTEGDTPVFDPESCPIGAMAMHADPAEDFEGYETPKKAAEARLDDIPHSGELVMAAERADDAQIVENDQERESRERAGLPQVYVVVDDSGAVVAELIAGRLSNGGWNVWDLQWCE